MKYLGYAATAVAAFLGGWILRSRSSKPNDEEVGVTVKVVAGQLTKDLYATRLAVRTKDNVTWAVYNDTDSPIDVSLVDFRVSGSGETKVPLTGPLAVRNIAPQDTGYIPAMVKPNAFLDEPPRAKDRDEFNRRYQDITYSMKVGNQTIDPEIRIREY